MVGYHGESSRCSIQRQSHSYGSKVQTGTARAPARCAVMVSTVITKCNCLSTRAVSSILETHRCRSHIWDDHGNSSLCSAPDCSPKKEMPGTLKIRAISSIGIDLAGLNILADQAMPTRRPVEPSWGWP